MKTPEQALEEYCQLRPVQCFCSEKHKWEEFETCCLKFAKQQTEVFRCRDLIVRQILFPDEGRIFKAISFLFPNELGAALMDPAFVLAEKLFDLLSKKWLPQFLVSCETKEEVLKKFPSFEIPKIDEMERRAIENLYLKYESLILVDAKAHADDGGFDFQASDLKSTAFPISFSVKRLWISQYLKVMLENEHIFLSTLIFHKEFGVVAKIGDGRGYEYYSFPKLTAFKHLRPNQVEHLFPQRKKSGT